MNPHVVAVILNYNRAQDTIDCINSLQKCTYHNLRIVLIDNASTDSSFDCLHRSLPGVEIIQTTKNLGFAGGNNFGIQHAMRMQPDYVLLINNDTIVEPDFLNPLVQGLETNMNAAVASGTICYYQHKDRVWYAGGRFVPYRAASFADYLDMAVETIPVSSTRDVTFISGCLMLIRASALESVGLFDERFFMYFEDAELSLRFLTSGYRLIYVPSSRIYHKTTNQADTVLRVYYFMRNRLLFMKTSLFGVDWILACAYLSLINALKLISWLFSGRIDLFSAAVAGIGDYCRNSFYQRGFDRDQKK